MTHITIASTTISEPNVFIRSNPWRPSALLIAAAIAIGAIAFALTLGDAAHVTSPRGFESQFEPFARSREVSSSVRSDHIQVTPITREPTVP
jgi:hypothetical protein